MPSSAQTSTQCTDINTVHRHNTQCTDITHSAQHIKSSTPRQAVQRRMKQHSTPSSARGEKRRKWKAAEAAEKKRVFKHIICPCITEPATGSMHVALPQNCHRCLQSATITLTYTTCLMRCLHHLPIILDHIRMFLPSHV